jgi:hypothetical protein
MRNVLMGMVVFAAACQPMYDAKAPKLKDPPIAKHDKSKDPPPPEPTYDEKCTVDFSAPPTQKRQTKVAQQHLVAGDTAIESAQREPAKQEMAAQGVEQYRQALIADPYNAEATLKLALAYDKVLRKGCALAMLKRLDALAANPKFGAEPQINRVLDNESWFKPYRTDALKALGK